MIARMFLSPWSGRGARVVSALLLLVLAIGQGRAEPAARKPFPERWIAATNGPEPVLQVQRWDGDTFILRQSIETNFEGPFLYLLFGKDRALLVDTGAGGLQIEPTIDGLVHQWLAEKHRASIPLIVAHSHAHGDHVAGDGEFVGRPDVTLVGHSPEQVAAFFKIEHWPDDIAHFDLGGRILAIIPTPGHEPAHLMIFDPRTHFLLTGDELYPGRLYFPRGNLDLYRRSIDRAVAFTKSRHVSWLMGAHIEMTTKPGEDYPMHAPAHPDEHVLELPYARLLELQAALHRMGDTPKRDIHGDFIIYPTGS
jgi:hydroxyacylglutathione hydrolase